MSGGKMSGEMFDDMTLPIKFNITANDDAFEKITNGNVSCEWFWKLADAYSHFFDDMDINVFVAYDKQSTVTFNENVSLVTDNNSQEEK